MRPSPSSCHHPQPTPCSQLNLFFENLSTKRIFARFLGTSPSLTPRPDPADPTPATPSLPLSPFLGGRVSVFGRGATPAVIANVTKGINWTAAAVEKVLLLPERVEWEALAKLAGTP